MSGEAPKSFTIPFFSFIIILLSIGLYLMASFFLQDNTHDPQRWLILSIMILADMLGFAVVVPHLIIEIKEKRK